ncbi:zinc knuckle CX2CX4HX4C containing protein [Tanacetum coccineum]
MSFDGESQLIHTPDRLVAVDGLDGTERGYQGRLPLKTLVDYENFANGIEMGTYEVWSKLTSQQRKAILKTASAGWTTLMELKSATPDLGGSPKTFASVLNPGLGAAGASAKDQPKVNLNFRPLVADPVFDGVNISIPRKVVEKVSTHFEHTVYGHFIGKRMAFLVVEYYARKNWAKHGLKRIMMNTKGFFFFKFDSRAGLEAVLEHGPWLIRKSSIIIKKWSMDTRLLKEELTRIPIWVKLHDVPIQVFEWSSFAQCLIEVNSKADLVDVVTIGVPSLTGDDFTKETIHVEYEWRPPRCDVCKIFGHLHDHCPKKEASPLIVSTSNVVTPTVVKTNDGFQTMGKKKKRKGSLPNVGNPSNITSPNSFSALNVEVGEEEEEEEEAVENVYDEMANIFPNTKTGRSSSFSVAAG